MYIEDHLYTDIPHHLNFSSLAFSDEQIGSSCTVLVILSAVYHNVSRPREGLSSALQSHFVSVEKFWSQFFLFFFCFFLILCM